MEKEIVALKDLAQEMGIKLGEALLACDPTRVPFGIRGCIRAALIRRLYVAYYAGRKRCPRVGGLTEELETMAAARERCRVKLVRVFEKHGAMDLPLCLKETEKMLYG